MLDIKKIRRQPDWFKEKLATRGIDAAEIDEVLELDQKRRELLRHGVGLSRRPFGGSDGPGAGPLPAGVVLSGG